jgi:hypothetical protein
VRPLSEQQTRCLLANYATAVESIDTKHGLLAELLSADIISWRQKDFVEAGISRLESNERLLDIVRRGSETDFMNFLDCLNKTGQQQDSRYLREDEVTAHVSANFQVLSQIYILAYQRHRTAKCNSVLHIEKLHCKLLEIIVIKAVGQLFVDFIRLTPKAQMYAATCVNAVSRNWWKLVNFRHYNKRLLKRYFRNFCFPFTCCPRQLPNLRLTGERYVMGVAEMNGKLYVACEGSNKIQVFTSWKPCTRLEDIKIRGLADPIDNI